MLRPPVTWIAVAFGAGLWVGLSCFRDPGSAVWDVVPPVLVVAAALPLSRRTPLGAAIGIMTAAGSLWGAAALQERSATCAGIWGRPPATGDAERVTASAIVRLLDPVPTDGGLVDADVVDGARCGGTLRLRWPDGHKGAGGTTWVVAGHFAGDAARGVLVARTVRLLDATRRGRGAVRDRVTARAEALFGARAPMVEALVLARRADLDPAIRERYARA